MSEVNYGAFRQAAHFHAGRIAPVRLGVLHATAGLENASGMGAEQVMNMFADPHGRVASAHVTCDQNSIARSVHDRDTAFAAAHANSCGLHIEQVGLTTQDRAHWLDPISKATINNAVRVARDWSNSYGIAKRHLTLPEVQAILHDPVGTRLSGWTDHATVQRAWPSTGHTDPGPGYPWDYFMTQLTAGAPHPAPHKPVHNPHATPDFVHNTIHIHEKGEPVLWVQWALRQKEDGDFGPATEAAVKAMQRKYGYTADGVVGATTGGRLLTFTR